MVGAPCQITRSSRIQWLGDRFYIQIGRFIPIHVFAKVKPFRTHVVAVKGQRHEGSQAANPLIFNRTTETNTSRKRVNRCGCAPCVGQI